MQEFLSKMTGKRIDVVCNGGSVSGEVVKVEGSVLHLKDGDYLCYVAIDKIAFVWDARDREHRPGFVAN